MRKTKVQEGITLVALIITVIVLLILAGVSISALSGENGILIRAKKAKEQNDIAIEKESLNMAILAIQRADLDLEAGKEALQRQLDISVGVGKTKVTETINKYEVLFVDSQRYYEIDKKEM